MAAADALAAAGLLGSTGAAGQPETGSQVVIAHGNFNPSAWPLQQLQHFIAVVSPVDSCAATCAQPVDKGIESFGTIKRNSLVSTTFLLISVKCSSNAFPKTLDSNIVSRLS